VIIFPLILQTIIIAQMLLMEGTDGQTPFGSLATYGTIEIYYD